MSEQNVNGLMHWKAWVWCEFGGTKAEVTQVGTIQNAQFRTEHKDLQHLALWACAAHACAWQQVHTWLATQT